MTLRKFFLLLGEFYFQQQLQDVRFYKLICCHFKEPPEPKAIFPMLDTGAEESSEELVDDDVATFQQVTASLMPYNQSE